MSGGSSSSAIRPGLRRWRWICLLAAAFCSLVVLVPVLSHKGWPFNHEATAAVLRMSAMLGQWQAGEPLPVWSTRQQFYFGSPMPALYHKVHMFLSSAVLAATGSVKAALVLPLWLFMVAGFCGMALCLRHALAGRHPWLWLLGGAVLLSSNYATTDWVVRGAFAEFAAMMLIPWVMAWCVILLNRGRWPLWIGPLLALLALSHTSVGLFALVPLAIAGGLALGRWGWQAARRWLWPALASGAMGLLIVLPFALPMLAAARFNRVDRLLLAPYFTPRTNGVPWQSYFWDPTWVWVSGYHGFTAQLDTGLLVLLALFVLLMLLPARLQALRAVAQLPQERWVAGFLLATLGVMAWLQLPPAAWVYEEIPGARYLQFAWRLLAYLTVTLVLCACMALSRLALWHPRRLRSIGPVAAAVAGCALLACTAYPKMWWNWTRYEWYPPEILQFELRSGDYMAIGEFLPLVDWPEVGIFDAMGQLQSWMVQTWAEQPALHDCQITPAQLDLVGERRSAAWHVACPHGARIALPVFLAPGMAGHVRRSSDGDWRELAPGRTCSDPRVKLTLPDGASDVRITYPSWRSMVVAGFSSDTFDYRRDCGPAPGAPSK